jgi:hypothetical protein
VTTELPFGNPLPEAYSGFPIATSVTLKVVPKAACDESERKPEHKFDEAFRTNFRISNNFCLHCSASRNYIIIFSWKAKQPKTSTTFVYA